VSYWTGAAHRGHGVATRALELLLLHADRDGIVNLECRVAEDNAASRRVAEAVFEDPRTFVDAHGQVMVHYIMCRADRCL
jgi:predicted acetyltransferase